ncbi:MAG: metal ABC transporter permease [Geminicoccaceae bacterium]|nr:metal ABC transporter permease [Geminicoccaceae bacterium]MCX8099809.1 metal ABC transporter permease [Geminicoccaceae bacterium]MDW8368771.1 metal ABC transporter permease [Geminicoccaceae bacterium]
MIELRDFLEIDLPALATSTLAALSCGLLGNFLLLQRRSLLGDAISHAVLPGIVLAFVLTGELAAWAMMAGASAAAVLAVVLIALLERFGRVETSAATGVVLTTMFALGVVLLEQTGAQAVHLDVQHALMGSLETIVWLGAGDGSALLDAAWLAAVPDVLVRLALVAAGVMLLIGLLFKELAITSFDPGHATSIGISAHGVGFVLLVAAAVVAVASFQAVGAILTVALFVCPAATARMLTDRLETQLALSAAAALLAGVLGYALAAWAPLWLGVGRALNAAGMIAVVAGVLQALAILFAPRYGMLTRWRRRQTPASSRTEPAVGAQR